MPRECDKGGGGPTEMPRNLLSMKGNRAAAAAIVAIVAIAATLSLALSRALATPPEKAEKEAKRLLGSDDYTERIRGVGLLSGVKGDRRAEKTLIDVLRHDADWDVQNSAAAALGKIGVARARDALALHAVDGEIAAVRSAAVEALAPLEPDRVGTLLLDVAKRTRDERSKARAVHAAAPYMTEDDVVRLAAHARGKDDYVAREAARALGLLYADVDARDAAADALASVLQLRDDHRKFLQYSGALLGLAAAATPSARETLVQELLAFPDDDDWVTERVARALASADPDEVAALVAKTIKADPRRKELRRLARAVGRAGIVPARTALEELIAHPEARVRSEAVRAIGMLGDPQGVAAVRPTLADASPYVRVEAVIALAQLLPHAEFAALGELLRRDGDMRVRLQFVTQIYDMLDPVGIEPLVAYLDDETWYVSTAAAAAIGALGVAEDMPRLLPSLKDRDWKMRAAAYEGLGRLRAAEAIPHLIEGLRDRDTVVRGVCLTNLQILTSIRKAYSPKGWEQWYAKQGAGLRLEKRSRKPSAEATAREEANSQYKLTRDQGVEVLQKARILVVTGAWDKVQLILDHLSIQHTLMRAQELKEAGLNPNQVLLVNCEGNLDSDTMERVAWFVNVGGYAMTTDWALTKTVMPVFPGYVTQFARASTGNDVVTVEEAIPGHALTRGVLADVPAPLWWLEIQAFPITITYPERVEVIVDSAEMRHRYGSSPVGIAFRAGLGKIQHSASHFYLQEEGMQHASKPRERMVFAADNLGLSLDTIRKMSAEGAFDGRLSEKTLQQIAPDYSMFRLIVNMVLEKSEWVENL